MNCERCGGECQGHDPTNPRFDSANDPVFVPICRIFHEPVEPRHTYCDEHDPDT